MYNGYRLVRSVPGARGKRYLDGYGRGSVAFDGRRSDSWIEQGAVKDFELGLIPQELVKQVIVDLDHPIVGGQLLRLRECVLLQDSFIDCLSNMSGMLKDSSPRLLAVAVRIGWRCIRFDAVFTSPTARLCL